MNKFVWRIIVCPLDDEFEDKPYPVDFDTPEEADKAYIDYCSELTLSGKKAFSCTPPFSVEVVNL